MREEKHQRTWEARTDADVAERIDDQAILRLIKKWLKAGVLDTDGFNENL